MPYYKREEREAILRKYANAHSALPSAKGHARDVGRLWPIRSKE
jgi:hypothetical protein